MIIANGKCTREHNESLPLTTKMHLSLMIKMNNELNIKAKATIYYEFQFLCFFHIKIISLFSIVLKVNKNYICSPHYC